MAAVANQLARMLDETLAGFAAIRETLRTQERPGIPALSLHSSFR